MGDTPEQQATKDALAILGKWKSGQTYSGLDLMGAGVQKGGMAGMPGLAAAPALEHPMSLVDVAKQGGAPMVGATLGQMAPVPPWARFLLSGAGGAAGHLFNVGAGITPAQTLSDALIDAGITGLGAMGGQATGAATTKTAGTLTRSVTPAPAPGAPGLRQTMQTVGVDPTMADVSPNMAALERSVAQTPTGGPIIRAAADRRAAQLSRARDEFLDRVAPASAGERMVVGGKASEAILRHSERTGALEDVLWTQMGQLANDVPVRLDNLKAFADAALLNEKRGKAPNKAVVSFLEGITQEQGEWAWQVADATRKQYGRNQKGVRMISEVPESVYKGAYAALLRDMEAAADASTLPGVRQSYRQVRDFSEHRRAIFRDGEVAKILETDPEKVVKMLNVGGGPSAVKRAREAILGSPETGLAMASPGDVEAWNYVRRHILEGAFSGAVDERYKGLSNPVIVGSRLDKALKVLGDDTLKELLTPTELEALKNIRAVAKAIRASETIGALPGTSTTPQGLGFVSMITGLPGSVGAGLGGLVGGPIGSAVGGGVASTASFILVPHIAARILTNPAAARIVASPAFGNLANVSRLGAGAAREGTQALARLAGILYAQQQGEGE